MKPYIPATNEGRNFYLEYSLCEYDGIPVVFVASDDKKNIYLCECTDTRFGEQNWTIVNTDQKTIQDIIYQQITLYEAIHKYGNSVVLVKLDIKNDVYFQTITKFESLNKENLPDFNAKVWITNDSAIEDTNRLYLERSLSQTATVSTYNEELIYAGQNAINKQYINIKLPFAQWEDGTFDLSTCSSLDKYDYKNGEAEAA